MNLEQELVAPAAEAGQQPLALDGARTANRSLLVRGGLESALIVLSVLLALFLDEWRSEREVEARVATARSYLVREIRTNRDALRDDARYPYHVRTLRLLEETLAPPGAEQKAAVARMRAGAFTGVHPFHAQDVAWTSFRTAELTSRLPAEEIFLLARIYDAQDSLKRISEVAYGGMVQPSADMDSDGYQKSQIRVISIYFSDAIPAERELLRLYDEALRKMKEPAAH